MISLPVTLRNRYVHSLLVRLMLLAATSAALASPLLAQAKPADAKAAKPTRLLDRQAFDRITLNAASGGNVIETLLLELPERRVPNPLPSDGALELRRLSEPSVLYTVPWNSIERVELFEQLLLAEAVDLAKAKDLGQSFEYLSFLYKNYPDLEGIAQATASYLRQDAQVSYAAKKYEETLTILLSLYELNPRQRGLKSMVETVTDRMINQHLADRDFGAARSVLDMLKSGFPALKPANIESWQKKFDQGAKRQLTTARQAIEEERFSAARRAVRRALAILPDATGAEALMDEIDRLSPQLVVGVDQLVRSTSNKLEWSTARIAELVEPKLVTLVDFGAEGGEYACDWGKLASDDTGLLLALDLNQSALQQGITSEAVALELLSRADPLQQQFRADFAGLLDAVEIGRGDQVKIHWRRSHVRPEALLPLSLQNLTDLASPPNAYQVSVEKDLPDLVTFRSLKDQEQANQAETIIEKYYENDEVAIVDLVDGEIDVLSRIPPWQVTRLQQTPGIVVAPYRLPTVHVLIPNYDKPLMGRREFRRALCYGIDRGQILNDILLGGERRAGFRVLSAPLPAGVTITDPVGYAYNQGRQPRAYEPRLAAVLASVARNSLAKQAAKKNQAAKSASESEGAAPTASGSETPDEATSTEKPEIKPDPLVLAHPPHPTAATVCQTIKLQLGAIGIPIKLQEITPDDDGAAQDYDLRYAELAIWEPIVDVRELLGPDGIVGSCSSSMSLAIHDVEQAKNWKEVRARLQEVHEIAFNDLPVIPLWQTVDFFAHRKSLDGIGSTPVTLYQNVNQWKRTSGGSKR